MRPTVNEVELVKNKNEIAVKKGPVEDNPSNVLMSQATGDSIFTKTEVLAGQSSPWFDTFVVVLFLSDPENAAEVQTHSSLQQRSKSFRVQTGSSRT